MIPRDIPVFLEVFHRGAQSAHKIKGGAMEYVLNFITNILCYISIPVVIRYVILRRPIHNKWAAIGVLVPIFIGFAILINVQRAEMQKELLEGSGIPYKSSGHMIGSPILYAAMFFSYSILRRGSKKTNIASDNTSDPVNDVITPLNETENERTITDQTDYASNDIVPQKLEKTVNISAKRAGIIKKGIIFVVCLFLILGSGLSIFIAQYPSSIHSLRVKAMLGSAEAQFNLGNKYDDGQGVPQDFAEAVKWYRMAADQGYAGAQVMLGFLGVMYEKGQGVPQDDAEAVKRGRKAAEQGDAGAQNNLGVMYFQGQGVPQDYAKAVKWYRKAAAQGSSYAQYNLGWMYSEGQGVPQDYAESAKWYRKAAEQGDAGAQVFLGIMYKFGKGVPQDYAEAVKWYRKAAEQWDAGAQVFLGEMYKFGRGVPQDYTEAAKWYSKAAEQGNAEAQSNLGIMYDFGKGVPQDYTEAEKWYRKAAEQGDAGAQYNLGVMYFNGQGVPQDYVTAHLWFNLAASQGDKTAENLRDLLSKTMTPAQIAEAQRLAREWKPKKPEEHKMSEEEFDAIVARIRASK